MSKLSVKIEYDKKVKELQQMVAEEAKRLQDVVDKKNKVLLQIKDLSIKKNILVRGIDDLEQKAKEKENTLNQLIQTEESYISSSKIELNKEKDSLNQTKSSLDSLTERLKEMKAVAFEIEEFIKKEANARMEYLVQEERLQSSQTKYRDIALKTELDMKELEKRGKELDVYKQYISDLYGKLATYVKLAKETVEYVNGYMKEKGVPIEFQVPENGIITINLDNFTKKPVDL